MYKAPPVVKGRVPKNVYGNLDIYAPTMVPAGGSHILHPETARAARTLGIDYSDAVTGFSFKGRHGTAVINGAVVATEFREAVQEVLHAFEDEMADEEARRRSSEALRFWKRLLTGLRIRERINGYEIEGERKALDEKMGAVDEIENEEDDSDGGGGGSGGGFFPDSTIEDTTEPTAGQFDQYNGTCEQDETSPGGFLTGGRADQSHRNVGRQHGLGDDDDLEGGGFIVENLLPEDGQAQENYHKDGAVSFIDDRSLEKPPQNTSDSTEEPANFYMYDAQDLRENLPTAQGTKHLHQPNNKDNYNPNPCALFAESKTSMAATTTTSHDEHPSFIMQTSTPTPSFAHLNLPESELAEATMLAKLHEASQHYIPSPTSAAVETFQLSQAPHEDISTIPDVKIPSTGGGEMKMKKKRKKKKKKAEEEEDEGGEEEEEEEMAGVEDDDDDEQEGTSSSDAGSLLSHDPEDEDADPEWLI